MDDFKRVTLNDYTWEMDYANELNKNKLRKFEKKFIRKTSRNRLKRELSKYVRGGINE